MEIKDWLQQKIAEECNMEVNEVSCDQSFDSFDLDSLSLVSFSYDLEKLLNKDISPTVFTEFDTINKLAEWIKSRQ